MSSFANFLSNLFGRAKAEAVKSENYRPENSEVLEIERVAIQTAVRLIAVVVAQCDFRTFVEGEEKKDEEYYLWNYEPNRNQNSTQFLSELIETLVYNNEALIVEKYGQLFVADSYGMTENGTRETMFEGIQVGNENLGNRRAREVIYLKLSNTNIRPLLSNVCRQYEDIMTKAKESYEKANAEKGILNIDASKKGKIGYDEIKTDLLDKRFKAFFSNKNSVLPLYDGFSYTPHTHAVRNVSEINDIKSMTDEVYNRVGQAFGIPPSLLRGQVEQTEDNTDNFMLFAIHPITNMLQEEITRKRCGRDGIDKGYYIVVDASNVEIGGIFKAAEKIDKLIGCGVYSIDEVRGKIGEPLLGTEEAQRHYVTKNYEQIGVEEKKK